MELTKFEKNDFENILKNYDLGEYLSHKHIPQALENTVYLLKTNKGKYILKIFEYTKIGKINFQIQIMEFLKNKNIPVQEVYKTKKNKSLLVYKKKRLMIHEFVDGINPKEYDKKLLTEIINVLGRLDKALQEIRSKNKYFSWKEYQFIVLKTKNPVFEGFDMKKENQELIKNIKKIDFSKLQKGLVHGDYHSKNLLVKDNKLVCVIDWGDSRYRYIVQDLTTLLNMGFVDGYIQLTDFKKYLDIYQKHIKFNDEELKSIYYFMINRFLGCIVWHIEQSMNHLDQQDSLKQQTRRWINKYNEIKNISPEKFLSDYLK